MCVLKLTSFSVQGYFESKFLQKLEPASVWPSFSPFANEFSFYLCKSICLSAGAAFLATSCSLGALALPASKPPGLS